MGIMSQPYKHPKTGVYWIRRSVPKGIRETFGKTEVKRSLRTKDLSEARVLYPIEYDKINQEFIACRREQERKQALAATSVVEQDSLSPRDINILTARYYNAELSRMQQSKTLGEADMLMYDLMAIRLGEWRDGSEAAEAVLESVDDSDVGVSSEMEHSVEAELEAVFGDVADELIASGGYLISRDNVSYKRLLTSLGRLVPRLRQAVIDLVHFTGNEPSHLNTERMELTKPLEREESTESSLPSKGMVTIRQVFASYCESTRSYNKGRSKATESTLRDYQITVERFDEFLDGKSICEVTKTDVLRFSDLLLTLPSRAPKKVRALPLMEQAELAKSEGLALIAPSTVRKQLMGLSAVFEYATEHELCAVNPVHKTTKRLTKSIEARTGSEKQYAPSDLRAIFASPIFTDNYRPKGGRYGEAVHWIPLLAYYTGARVEELCQLHLTDIRSVDGINYIDVNAETEDKSVKNKGSVRRIPIHSHLIELGFIDYVVSLQQSQVRVFPALTRGSGGKYSPQVSKWLGDYFRSELKVNPEVKPMHGFRHTFKTLARSAGIAKDISDVLTGHSSGDVSDTYGEYPLGTLSEAIEKIPRVLVSKR